LCCGKDKSVSLSDTRLKEPVVRLKRLSAEVSVFVVCRMCYCVEVQLQNSGQMSFSFGDAGYAECDAVLLDDTCPVSEVVSFYLQGLKLQEE